MVLFANTGQEHEKTLDFVRACDKHWGFDTVWIEAKVLHGVRKSTTHRVVSYETATRGPQLFDEMARKYGIPNKAFPHCTRELKLNPMKSYMRSLGLKNNRFITAIGIRADEVDRVSAEMFKLNYWYPLVDLGVTKEQVEAFWREQEFDLDLPATLGNCLWCYKKSYNKLRALHKSTPEIFEVPAEIERKYRMQRPERGPQAFFRGPRSTEELLKAFAEEQALAEDPNYEGSCAESCEAFT